MNLRKAANVAAIVKIQKKNVKVNLNKRKNKPLHLMLCLIDMSNRFFSQLTIACHEYFDSVVST